MKLKLKIYLAGPMHGCTSEGRRSWRDLVKFDLPSCSCYDPTVEEPKGQDDVVLQDVKAISECDLVLVNYWQKSTGTAMEMVYASLLGIPIVTVVPEKLKDDAWLLKHAGFMCSYLSEAVHFISFMDVAGWRKIKNLQQKNLEKIFNRCQGRNYVQKR